jgi:hypothetical protein
MAVPIVAGHPEFLGNSGENSLYNLRFFAGVRVFG